MVQWFEKTIADAQGRLLKSVEPNKDLEIYFRKSYANVLVICPEADELRKHDVTVKREHFCGVESGCRGYPGKPNCRYTYTLLE